ncbi:hypothetical protein F4819DRAFT_482077 [Hypoxylon fuscum]|nr:hypothetical protein F4819DRAFT_482077 [Hypoxylon fuscum]
MSFSSNPHSSSEEQAEVDLFALAELVDLFGRDVVFLEQPKHVQTRMLEIVDLKAQLAENVKKLKALPQPAPGLYTRHNSDEAAEAYYSVEAEGDLIAEEMILKLDSLHEGPGVGHDYGDLMSVYDEEEGSPEELLKLLTGSEPLPTSCSTEFIDLSDDSLNEISADCSSSLKRKPPEEFTAECSGPPKRNTKDIRVEDIKGVAQQLLLAVSRLDLAADYICDFTEHRHPELAEDKGLKRAFSLLLSASHFIEDVQMDIGNFYDLNEVDTPLLEASDKVEDLRNRMMQSM